MKIRSIYFLIIIGLVIISCKKDDNSVSITPPEDLSVKFLEDDAKLQEYFTTHFYNYEEFTNPQSDFDYVIKIDTIAGDNSNKISLKDSPNFGFKTLVVNSEQYGIDNNESIEHKIYYIVARQGVGASTTFADSTYVQYEGSLLDGTVFDKSTAPFWVDLPGNQINPGFIPGFVHGITSLKAGGDYVENGDGTFTVEGYGIGAIFMPSALAYYSSSRENIPQYSPLVFKLNLFAVNETDHDKDGIPSYLEDLNNNGFLTDDNTDFDKENITKSFVPNYLDPDDDGDGKLTKDEIIINADGSLSFPDTNGDGIPDYLDKDTK